MNVFATYPCPIDSAQSLCDRHVVKMTLETAQILSTVARDQGHDEELYRATHKYHPCTVACVQDLGYRAWTALHGLALAEEYGHRYGKTHASLRVIEHCIDLLPLGDAAKVESWPLAMPDEYKSEDPHASYRAYLSAKYAGWARPAKWTQRTEPTWSLR